MYLPGHFLKANRWIKCFPNLVLFEGFNTRVRHTLIRKVPQCMLDQAAAEPLPTEFRIDGKVGDVPYSGQPVAPARDITHDHVVHDDADLDHAAARIAAGGFR